MILVSNVIERLEFLLDDNGVGRYDNERDYFPAINLAINHVVSLFTVIFDRKLLYGDALKELLNYSVVSVSQAYQTHSEINFTLDSISNFWTVLYVEPNVNTNESNVYIGSNNTVARHISFENWNVIVDDPFAAGNSINSIQVKPAFTIPYINSSNNFVIYLRPVSLFPKDSKVAVWYLRKPNIINSIADYIELPEVLSNFITAKALNYISFQHGKETSVFNISNVEISQIISLFKNV